ncbi:MAG: hypothetical protein ICV68_04155 [Pyrinomonadaceae bacterium]|nr:hypothetical protein [Pyrinomonadaceae bacterium]
MRRFVSLSLLILFLSTLALAQTKGGVADVRSLQGTSWVGTVRAPDSNGEFHDNSYQIDFLPGNQVRWNTNGNVYTNGKWRQNGRSFSLELNDGYSTWLGTIEGDRISGNSINKLGHKWTWSLSRKGSRDMGGGTPITQPTGGWIKYTSNEGRFSVLMPVQPKVSSQPVDTAAGKLINNVVLSQTTTAAYAVSYADYPQNNADPQTVLDSVRSGAINGIKGTLISGKNITHKGFPGREFQASTEGALYTSRIFLVNNRLYQMVVVAPANQSSATDVNKFLTSFDLRLEEQ